MKFINQNRGYNETFFLFKALSSERTYLQTTSDMDRIIYGLMECFQIVINKDEVKSLTENISRTT